MLRRSQRILAGVNPLDRMSLVTVKVKESDLNKKEDSGVSIKLELKQFCHEDANELLPVKNVP